MALKATFIDIIDNLGKKEMLKETVNINIRAPYLTSGVVQRCWNGGQIKFENIVLIYYVYLNLCTSYKQKNKNSCHMLLALKKL